MIVRAFNDIRVVIVPGLHGSGPGHWQTRWQASYQSFERVEQLHWDQPDLAVWSARLDQVLKKSDQPVVIIAHSFGCLTSVHRAAAGVPNLIGALLVAPADPEKFGVVDALREAVLPCPSIVIASADDPWMEQTRAAAWARRWGGEFVDAGALGHVNAESGLGDWEFGLAQFRRLVTASHLVAIKACKNVGAGHARDGVSADAVAG